MKKSYGIGQILNWKFEQHTLPTAWHAHLGTLPQRFIMYVDGDGGQGKTEYCMQLAMMLAAYYGKVHLNNLEQAKHPQVRESAVRNKFADSVPKGKFIYSVYSDFEQYKAKLRKRNSGRVQIIDSSSLFSVSVQNKYKNGKSN